MKSSAEKESHDTGMSFFLRSVRILDIHSQTHTKQPADSVSPCNLTAVIKLRDNGRILSIYYFFTANIFRVYGIKSNGVITLISSQVIKTNGLKNTCIDKSQQAKQQGGGCVFHRLLTRTVN